MKKLCLLVIACAALSTLANDPIDWKYDTSGRVEGATSEQTLALADSVSMVLSFYAWSVGFDIDTNPLGLLLKLK